SRSLTSARRMTSKASASPSTNTRFGGPINSNSVLPVVIFGPHAPIVLKAHSLHQHGHGLLDAAPECRKQLRPERAVHHAMITRQRPRHDADKGDPARGRLDRLPARSADRENGRLRRIDDGGELAHAVHAEVGDGGGAALILVWHQLSLSRARRQLAH